MRVHSAILYFFVCLIAIALTEDLAHAQNPTEADCKRACIAQREEFKSFSVEGRVAHCTCTCPSGSVRAKNFGGRCVSRTECVRDAGSQLRFAVADCSHDKVSVLSSACRQGLGLSEKTLSCLASLPGSSKNKIGVAKACGELAAVPIDAAIGCADVNDQCVVKVLQTHKDSVAECQK
jgi:hypothetical protein